MTDPRNIQGLPPPPLRRDATRLALGSQSFSDKVMTRVKAEPRPTPARAFVASLLALAPRDAAAALGTARRLGFRQTHSVPPFRGLQSLTVIAVVLAIVGIGGPLAASGTLNALGVPQAPQQPLPGGPAPAFVEVAAEASPDIERAEASPRAKKDSSVKQPKPGSKQQAATKQRAGTKRSGAKQQAGTKQRAGTKHKAGKKRQQVRETPRPRVRVTPEPEDDERENEDDSERSGHDEKDDPED